MQEAARMHAHLPRLDPAYYRGHAIVHWNLTVEDRKRGWLDPLFHARFREALLHAVARFQLVCPAYCLMPDHAHALWMGMSCESDQLKSLRLLRLQVNRLLSPLRLQKQAYDHVLREEEREHNAFQSIAFYVLENPVRAGLVRAAAEYPFSGCLVPGYPELHVHDAGFWELFWRIVEKIRAEGLKR